MCTKFELELREEERGLVDNKRFSRHFYYMLPLTKEMNAVRKRTHTYTLAHTFTQSLIKFVS